MTDQEINEASLTPEEEAQSDRMLDALLEDYRTQRFLPSWVEAEADRFY